MAESNYQGADKAHPKEAVFWVAISAQVDGDLRRRDVFPDLRNFTEGVSDLHAVNESRARELLEHARSMRGTGLSPGLRIAYGWLRKRLHNSLQREEEKAQRAAVADDGATKSPKGVVLWSDGDGDGAAVARRVTGFGGEFFAAHEASPAHFSVGDKVLCFDDEEYGEIVEVVGAYGPYLVNGCGNRLGYAVRRRGEKEFFAAAYRLMTEDCKVKHLQLVHPGEAHCG